MSCDLSIIVVALNERARLPLLLRQLDMHLGNRGLEVILIDNGSIDGTYEVMLDFASRHGNVLVIRSLGSLGTAFNDGVANARCRFLLFLGADMALPRDYIPKVMKMISNYPDCDAYVARLIPLLRFRGPLNDYVMGYFLGDTYEPGRWGNSTFHNGGLVISREVASRLGFRPLPVSVDGEFSYRFLSLGYRACYFPLLNYVLDEQYYDLPTMISYYRKLGLSWVVLLRATGSVGIALTLLKTLLEPLMPHYLVARYRKARIYVKVPYSTWLLCGFTRIYSMFYSILKYGLLSRKIPGKVTRRKLRIQ